MEGRTGLLEDRCNFLHWVGAIDGKHIDIVSRGESGSYYYNYKNKCSKVLMAIVDAKYRFLLADFVTNGRIPDGGVLQNNCLRRWVNLYKCATYTLGFTYAVHLYR